MAGNRPGKNPGNPESDPDKNIARIPPEEIGTTGATASSGSPGNIPAEQKTLIGRQQELAALRQMLTTSRLVTVTGLGGVGKTRTALGAAARAAPDFPDGAWLVELSGLYDGELLVHAVAATLRATDHTTRSQEEVLAAHLQDKRLLLVLDTCEHLLGPVTTLAEQLLRAAPGLHILATSRQPLGLDEERPLALGPLTDPADAVELFTRRAEAALPGFALSAAEQLVVERICTRLDGLPLAIELAAGLLGVATLDDLLSGIADRFQLLISSGDDSRHGTLRTAIGWSHELCRPQERLLWARLSVFTGDFSLAAAQEVCGDAVLDPADIPVLLAGLVDKSLLVRDPGPGGQGREQESGSASEQGPGDDRFRQLDTVRAYGAEWLHRLDEEAARRTRHLAWCQSLAERGERDWFGPGQAAVFRATQREHAQLCAALDFALSGLATPQQQRAGMRLAGTLWFYWVGCGLLGDGRYWLDRALVHARGPGPERLKALWVNGYVAILQGDSATAVEMLTDCRAQALRTGDDTAYAYSTHRLGCAALMRDDHRVAQRYFEASLDRYADLDELNSNVMMARIELAMSLAFQGDLETAVGLVEKARDLCELHGERWAKAYALYVLAFAAWADGRHEEADELARECLSINYEFRDLVGMVLPIEVIALLQASRGRSRQAAVLQGAAQRIWRKVGLPLFGSAYFNAPHDTAVGLAVADLGAAEYEAAFALGARLSLEEAVGSAREVSSAGTY
ncbi:ATP-binding protein [Streptomyces sp. NBC_01304]|uniref:ATP-binding protein n=1 Tax=Streptomyces sp. NBC_01304 TaxID=2903818 RepID=UPI002E11AC05|nr:tetratricopeptide repeat protein [Streptomyces sp. NBC_01304]